VRIGRFIWKTTRFAQMDAANTARAIAAAIEGEAFDLIVTGLQSDDFGAAQTGVLLAEILGIRTRRSLSGLRRPTAD